MMAAPVSQATLRDRFESEASKSWVDVTSTLHESLKTLDVGEVAFKKNYNAEKAMHALEIGTPKMDTRLGSKLTPKAHIQIAQYLENDSDQTHAAILDYAIMQLTNWIDLTATLPQSIFSLSLFHELPLLLENPNLKGHIAVHHGLQAILKIILVFDQLTKIAAVSVNLEDIFNDLAHLDHIFHQRSITQVEADLKQITQDPGFESSYPHTKIRLSALENLLISVKIITSAISHFVEQQLPVQDAVYTKEESPEYYPNNPKELVSKLNEVLTLANRNLAQAATTAVNKSYFNSVYNPQGTFEEEVAKAEKERANSTDLSVFTVSKLVSLRMYAEMVTWGPPKFPSLVATPQKSIQNLAKIVNVAKSAVSESVSSCVSLAQVFAVLKKRQKSKPALFTRVFAYCTLTYVLRLGGQLVENERRQRLVETARTANANADKAKEKVQQELSRQNDKANSKKKGKSASNDEEKLLNLRAAAEKAESAARDAALAVLETPLPANAVRTVSRLIKDDLIQRYKLDKIFTLHEAPMDYIIKQTGGGDLESCPLRTQVLQFVHEFTTSAASSVVMDILRAKCMTLPRCEKYFLKVLPHAYSLNGFSGAIDRAIGQIVQDKSKSGMMSFGAWVRDLVHENLTLVLGAQTECGLHELEDIPIIAWAKCEIMQHRLNSAQMLGWEETSMRHVHDFYHAQFLIGLFVNSVILTYETERDFHSRFALRMRPLMADWPLMSFKSFTEKSAQALQNHDKILTQAREILVKLKDHSPGIEPGITKSDILGFGDGRMFIRAIEGLLNFIDETEKQLKFFHQSKTMERFKFQGKLKLTLKLHPAINVYELV